MALVAAILEIEDQRQHKVPRYFRDRSNVFDHYSDDKLIHDFRLPKGEILKLIDLCQGLEPKQGKSTDIPVHLQVLATLRFFARATFQDDGKDIMGMSQQSFGKCIHRVTSALLFHAPDYVKFPRTEDQVKTKQDFYAKYGMPNVIGLIDGTHVKIVAPSVDEPLYVCRTGGHSVNIQFVCDNNSIMTNVVAKWPGVTHDSFIWTNCELREKFVNEGVHGLLLGDSGYGIEPWLLTPYESTPTQSHTNFNNAHTRTRSLVERAIGLWKNCFRRFHKTGGALQYTPKKVCRFIVASVILHNIRRKLKLPEDEDFLADPHFEFENQDNYINKSHNELLQAGNTIRNDIRENFFT